MKNKTNFVRTLANIINRTKGHPFSLSFVMSSGRIVTRTLRTDGSPISPQYSQSTLKNDRVVFVDVDASEINDINYCTVSLSNVKLFKFNDIEMSFV